MMQRLRHLGYLLLLAAVLLAGQAFRSEVSSVPGLVDELLARPRKGLGYAPSKAIKTNAAGELEAVIGTEEQCVKVNGTAGACGAGENADMVTAAGTLTSNAPVIGAGSKAVSVGTRSGNTTEFATVAGTKTASKQLAFDASGNVVASAYDVGAAGGGGGTTEPSGLACGVTRTSATVLTVFATASDSTPCVVGALRFTSPGTLTTASGAATGIYRFEVRDGAIRARLPGATDNLSEAGLTREATSGSFSPEGIPLWSWEQSVSGTWDAGVGTDHRSWLSTQIIPVAGAGLSSSDSGGKRTFSVTGGGATPVDSDYWTYYLWGVPGAFSTNATLGTTVRFTHITIPHPGRVLGRIGFWVDASFPLTSGQGLAVGVYEPGCAVEIGTATVFTSTSASLQSTTYSSPLELTGGEYCVLYATDSNTLKLAQPTAVNGAVAAIMNLGTARNGTCSNPATGTGAALALPTTGVGGCGTRTAGTSMFIMQFSR